MITAPKNHSVHLASAWTVGIATLFLGVGLQGIASPLLPEVPAEIIAVDLGDEIMLEEFDTEAMGDDGLSEEEVAEDEEASEEPTEEEEEFLEDFEIPSLPEVTEPLAVPEMTELIPLEKVIERPKPVARKPAPSKSTGKSAPARKSAPRRTRSTSGTSGGSGTGAGRGGGTGTGSGKGTGLTKGRFPQPSYPSSARRAKSQGVVKLSVTVQANGVPSSVTVSTSSGHSVLDRAARDHVARRWRWPSGKAGRFIVPIRFVLR